VNRILCHAGLPSGFRGSFPRQNALAYDGIAPDTRARLAAYFRPYNDQLARAFGPEFGWT
jgi:hypothetical protein